MGSEVKGMMMVVERLVAERGKESQSSSFCDGDFTRGSFEFMIDLSV